MTKLKVGWCARTVSAAAAPFAIAAKLGWLKQEGIDVELVPMPGSTDCVKNVAVREVGLLPAQRRAAGDRPPAGHQGEDLLHRVPGQHLRDRGAAGQPGQGVRRPPGQAHRRDLDGLGRRAGGARARPGWPGSTRTPTSTSSSPARARRRRRWSGAGRSTPSASSTRSTRWSRTPASSSGSSTRGDRSLPVERLPRAGGDAPTRRKEAVALARSYAKGTVFAIANPEAAIRILWEVFPATKPTGRTRRPRSATTPRCSRRAPRTGGSRRPGSGAGARTPRRTTAPTPSSC